MLQQTQVRTVLPYYRRFLSRFPDVGTLARTDEEEVLRYWAGLGYYSRAKNLHRAARMIVRECAGRFPDRLDEILKLPGVGRCTAGAIYSIAWNRPQPIVDGNVRRVVSRLRGIEGSTPERVFWDQAASWLPADRPGDFNQALMELGALVCLPAQPDCDVCPARSLCSARRKGIQNRIPAPRRARLREDVQLAVVVLIDGAQVLVTTERDAAYIPGKWGLPVGGAVSWNSPEAAAGTLARRIGAVLPQLEKCGLLHHGIAHRRITAHVFRARLDSDRAPVLDKRRYRWVDADDPDGILTSSLFRKALRSALDASGRKAP
jgi:A/G-specific adenine glycosylase